MDQYKNPHESKHTFIETHSWFEKNNFNFVSSVPKSSLKLKFNQNTRLFRKNY